MIAKNEEKNIAKALESMEGAAFEKIVVDTGSTDRTVEIASEMGAKVYHFKWVNDFAAARNYCVKQASGDWILSLDADEYLSPESASGLLDFLSLIQPESEPCGKKSAVSCMLVNLDDAGRQMTRSEVLRVFRNSPAIRFKGRIHEQITVGVSDIVHTGDVTIYHTGYSESAHTDTGKAQRNIALLREEIAASPDNLDLKAYLANSLSMGTDKESQSEAEYLFAEILGSKQLGSVNKVLRIKMYIYLINKNMHDTGKLADSEKICRKALAAFPGSLDFEYFLAAVLSKKGDYDKAWELLTGCEAKLISGAGADDSIMIPADPAILFSQMILTARDMGNIENVVLYSAHVLTLDKTRMSVLSPCIATLLHYGVSEAESIGLLSNIYDFGDPDDARFVADAAKKCGAAGFAERILLLGGL